VDRLDEKIRSSDVDTALKQHEMFVRSQLKFHSKDDIGLVANGWVRTAREINYLRKNQSIENIQRY
jgi:hypothetical protein